MKKNKIKNIVLSASVVFALFVGNTAFSEPALTSQPDEQAFSQAVNQIPELRKEESAKPEENLNIAAEAKTPMVEVNTTTNKVDQNIIPVLELKGGVKEKAAEQPSILKSWIQGDYLTGNWGGLRTKLEDHGITFAGSYMTDSFQKFRGGSKSETPFKTFGLVDTNLTLDTKKMGLWPGGTAFVRFQNKHGLGLSQDYIGDIQSYDSYESRRFAQISEYWYEQSVFNDRFKLKAGKQDANTDFCALDSGFNFINSSYSYMPTMPMPSYPDPALGLTATIKPVDWLAIRSGWFDGEGKGGTSGFDTAFDGKGGSFFIEELGVKHNLKNHPGNYLAGYWLHTGHVDELSADPAPRVFGQNVGWYAAAEQMLFKENKDENDDQGLTILGQFGWSPSDRSEVARYYGAGLQYKGLIPRRDQDIFGFGTAIAKLSGRLRDVDGRYGKESILESFYTIQLTPWLSIQNDMQFIFHPNGQEKSAFVMGARTLITF